jgi:hypothetical protein
MNFNNKSSVEIKKLFGSALPGVNFLNTFTLDDVEQAKKKLYFRYIQEYPNENKRIEEYLDSIGNSIVEEQFSFKKPDMVHVKNTVKDHINPNYKNTITRITELDSQFRSNLLLPNSSATSFSCQLTDTLTNVTSIKLDNICIPYTFYNVETIQGNNILEVSGVSYSVPDGNYTVPTLVASINSLVPDVSFVYDSVSGKTTMDNSLGLDVVFYSDIDVIFKYTKLNHSLGWILGFRDIVSTSSSVVSLYNSTVTSTYTTFIPITKYFVVLVDDHNHNHSNKSLVQFAQGKEHIKNTSYFKDVNEQITAYTRRQTQADTSLSGGDLCLETVSCNDLNPYILDDNRKLTQKQIYTQASINDTNNTKELKVKQEPQPNILAIIPFENKSLTWGQSTISSDKNHYVREYHGPVDIEKLTIKIYDDKGVQLNLNGNEWSATLLSKHLYKY